MKKLIMGFLGLMILSSCMEIDYNIEIDDKLGLNVEIDLDETKFNEGIREEIEKAKNDPDKTISYSGSKVIIKTEEGWTSRYNNPNLSPCDQDKFKDFTIKNIYDEISCSQIGQDVSNYRFLGGTIKDIVSLNNSLYTVTLEDIITKANGEDINESQTTSENLQMINSIKETGFRMDYTISFPGKIKSSDIGAMNDNLLSFSIYDVAETGKSEHFVTFEIGENDAGISVELEQSTNNIPDTNIQRTKAVIFKQGILAKRNLNKSVKYKKYIEQIDLVSEKMSVTKLSQILDRIEEVSSSDRAKSKYQDVLDYLEAKILLRLLENN